MASGVFVGSLSFDLTGSYTGALLLFTCFALTSVAIILRLGVYRYHGYETAVELGLAPHTTAAA